MSTDIPQDDWYQPCFMFALTRQRDVLSHPAPRIGQPVTWIEGIANRALR